MSDIAQAVAKLEAQLRAEGYKGTHKAMRLLKKFRLALKDAGYEFSQSSEKTTKNTAK